MEVLFSYGKRDGKIVHISEIGPEANGKRCGCVCPACGGALMAERGRGKLVKLAPSLHIDGAAALLDGMTVRQKHYAEIGNHLANK